MSNRAYDRYLEREHIRDTCACCECGYLRMGAHHPGIRCPKSGCCGECGNDWPCEDHAWMATSPVPGSASTTASSGGMSPSPEGPASKARKAGR